MFFKKKKINNKLNIYCNYSNYNGYYNIRKNKKINLEKFIKEVRIEKRDFKHGLISTEFNNIKYPVFDLDTDYLYNLFLNENKNDNYVVFRTSKDYIIPFSASTSLKLTNKYWVIIDDELKDNIKNYNLLNWHIINDKNYVNACQDNNQFFLRFTYRDINNKPIIIYKSENLSENFKFFIEKFEKLINEEGLELSVLIHKDEKLLKIYNRKQKIRRIIN